jgi:hypothetical protein
MVAQTPSDLHGGASAGEKGVVGARAFSAVAEGAGHGKSAAGVRGAPDRNALLCSLNGQSRAEGKFSELRLAGVL